MTEFAPQVHPISRLEKRIVSIDCRGNLEGSSTISGAPSVVEVSTAHLTIADIQVSTTSLMINDQTVPAGKAIQFTVDARGPSVKRLWAYAIQVTFDSNTGERIAGGIRLKTD